MKRDKATVLYRKYNPRFNPELIKISLQISEMDTKMLSSALRKLLRAARTTGPASQSLQTLIRAKIRQDYRARYLILTGDEFDTKEIQTRLQNTVNFIYNSTLGDEGKEKAILDSLIQFEASKAANSRLRGKFNNTTEIKNIKRYSELRKVERSQFMANSSRMMYITDSKCFDNQFAFGYLEIIKNEIDNDKNPVGDFHKSILDFELALVAFNEENKLFL